MTPPMDNAKKLESPVRQLADLRHLVQMYMQAMREIYRILMPGGTALIQAPIGGDVTREDAGITSPADRRRLYGQEDHVRRYGRDLVHRLGAAGFDVSVAAYAQRKGADAVHSMGLDPEEPLFVCRKH